MGRRGYVPLRHLGDVPLRRRWVFYVSLIWDVVETSLGVSFETCLRRREDVTLRRLSDVPLRRRWVFHLRRTCDVTGTYRETSLRRRYDVLLPGG